MAPKNRWLRLYYALLAVDGVAYGLVLLLFRTSGEWEEVVVKSTASLAILLLGHTIVWFAALRSVKTREDGPN